MNNFLYKASVYSVYIPFLMSIILFKRINRIYYPFLFFLFLTTINELFNSEISSKSKIELGSNILCLIEAFFISWLFKRWELIKTKKTYVFLLAMYCVAWLMDIAIQNIIIHPHSKFNTHDIKHAITYHFNWYFNILYSFIAALQSLTLISKLANAKAKNFHKNPILFVCSAFIIMYSFVILHTIFLLPYFKTSLSFKVQIWNLLSIAFIITYCIYAYAIALMTKYKAYKIK